jgi:ATP-dependent DNA helicase RecG
MFNIPVRPDIYVEKIDEKTVIKIWIDELPQRHKPLYFKSHGLPTGAFRRIGSTDQHCTEDDMPAFYQDSASFDQTPVKGASIYDVDEHAIKRYRVLREKVNPVAEELVCSDAELLQSLGCVNKEKPEELTVAGLVLFGTGKIQRNTFPMLRVDYIRVPGNTWVEDPDNRFTTIDMRGPLILMIFRLIDAINADLPKGFLLSDNEVQATAIGLPMKALREAIVNALMHRSYREHRPTQIIRYDNRIEIINPGFSLKPEDKLGQPGSETRNPYIAAVFHETNLAETKGSGIRSMRRLMQQSHLGPPTFESSRENNLFTARLLLHHFLDENDIAWLNQFSESGLNDAQKQSLIFVREVGAIDNHTYRQMADCDTLRASQELRFLKSLRLLKPKGKGKATYYVADSGLGLQIDSPANQARSISTHGEGLSTQASKLSPLSSDLSAQAAFHSTEATARSTFPPDLSTHGESISTHGDGLSTQALLNIPPELVKEIEALKQKEHDYQKIAQIIKRLCSIKALTSNEIAIILNRREDYIRRKYLSRMIAEKVINYTVPEMIKHPNQAYTTNSRK